MSNKILNVYFLLILVLAAVAGIFCWPAPYNQFIDEHNWKLPHIEEKDYKLGLDLKGGVHLEYEADLSQIDSSEKEDVMNGLRDIIERRVNIYGVTEPIVQIYGNNRIAVELPGVESIQDAIDWIGATPLLEFLEEKSTEEIDAIQAKWDEIKDLTTFEEIQAVDGWEKAFESPYQSTELTGRYLEKATLSFDQTTYAPIIELQFDSEGAEIFREITARNVGKTLAILLDGESIIEMESGRIYAPRVEQEITGGKAVITGETNIQDAKTIVQRLNQGALPVPLGDPIVQQKIGPTLGQVSLNNAVKAGIVGIIAIILFLIMFYRLPGLLGSLALIVYVLIMLVIIKIVPVTLTLAGIGGIILSIGMAVDANILIFSRMREEIDSDRSVYSSIEEGMNRAWTSIRDGNFTTLIVALILYTLGTSFIKAFSFTLILGILVSLFTAMVITRIFLLFFARGKIGELKSIWR